MGYPLNMRENFLPGVIGCFSMHAAVNPAAELIDRAFRSYDIPFRCVNFEVGQLGLLAAVGGAKAMGFRGLCCSMPNKIRVMSCMDEIAESARFAGAVNTVIIEKGGRMRGENTDGRGFVKAVSPLMDLKDAKVVILGAGGVARAIGMELARAGASRIGIINRHEGAANILAHHISVNTGAMTSVISWDHTIHLPGNVDLIVNATPLGLYPTEDSSIDLDVSTLRESMVVADCIPNPSETRFVKDARARGCQVLTGKTLLANQAALSIKLWTGEDIPPAYLSEEYGRLLSR